MLCRSDAHIGSSPLSPRSSRAPRPTFQPKHRPQALDLHGHPGQRSQLTSPSRHVFDEELRSSRFDDSDEEMLMPDSPLSNRFNSFLANGKRFVRSTMELSLTHSRARSSSTATSRSRASSSAADRRDADTSVSRSTAPTEQSSISMRFQNHVRYASSDGMNDKAEMSYTSATKILQHSGPMRRKRSTSDGAAHAEAAMQARLAGLSSPTLGVMPDRTPDSSPCPLRPAHPRSTTDLPPTVRLFTGTGAQVIKQPAQAFYNVPRPARLDPLLPPPVRGPDSSPPAKVSRLSPSPQPLPTTIDPRPLRPRRPSEVARHAAIERITLQRKRQRRPALLVRDPKAPPRQLPPQLAPPTKALPDIPQVEEIPDDGIDLDSMMPLAAELCPPRPNQRRLQPVLENLTRLTSLDQPVSIELCVSEEKFTILSTHLTGAAHAPLSGHFARFLREEFHRAFWLSTPPKVQTPGGRYREGSVSSPLSRMVNSYMDLDDELIDPALRDCEVLNDHPFRSPTRCKPLVIRKAATATPTAKVTLHRPAPIYRLLVPLLTTGKMPQALRTLCKTDSRPIGLQIVEALRDEAIFLGYTHLVTLIDAEAI